MATLLAAATETPHPLPMDPNWFGITALVIFAVLLGVTFAFRNVNNRH
jgi:hypothetical protein